MRVSLLFKIKAESELSPEQFAERLGIAGMTLRRWEQGNLQSDLPKKYETMLVEVMLQLVAEGLIRPNAASVQEVMKDNVSLSISAALRNVGLTLEDLKSEEDDSSAVLQLLSRIGLDGDRQKQVRNSSRSLTAFQKIGQFWKEKVGILRKVLASTELSIAEKLIAYGALFYLITPFDLVPDYIPGVGLLDDYALLAIACAYYVRRFSDILPGADAV